MTEGQRIWDVPTRVLHWVVALAVLTNLFFLEEGETPHRWVGYSAFTAVLLRLIWGLRTRSPSRLKNLWQSLWRSGADLPHSRQAAWTYLLMWIFILGLALSGWLMGTDAFWADETLDTIHSNLAKGMQILVVVHLAGISFDSLKFRRHTWRSMITGKR